MRDLTSKAIMNTFIELISEKPLSKITVKELTERCGITRRTFYYHFQDMYDLITRLFEAETERVINACQEGERIFAFDQWEDAFIYAARFVLENKQAIYHIYYSVRREELERYLKSISNEVIWHYIHTVCNGIDADEADKKLISIFYSNALTGMIQDWLENGMKASPEILIRRVGRLLFGNIEQSLKRSEEDRRHGRILEHSDVIREEEYMDTISILGQKTLGQSEVIQNAIAQNGSLDSTGKEN